MSRILIHGSEPEGKDLPERIISWLSGAEEFQFHTSGSTGKPKEIRIGRSAIISSIERSAKALNWNRADHFLNVLSTDTIAGAMQCFRALHLGADLSVLEPSGNPMQAISDSHPYTAVSFVPYQLASLGDAEVKKYNRFKTVLIGGAPLPARLESTLMKLDAATFITYGMTETVSHIALRKAGEDYYSLLEGINCRLSDSGTLKIMWGEMEVQTNDLAELIDERHFRLFGRADRMINSGGKKVNPEKLEDMLEGIFTDRLFFVAGVPHQELGEEVSLFVEAAEMSSEETARYEKTILSAVEKQLATLHKHERPRRIYFCKAFELTASQKIDRLATLRKLGITG